MHGMARAMAGSRGAHRGSISTWDARKPEKRMMTAASPRASEKEMINPARRVLPARSRSAAVKRGDGRLDGTGADGKTDAVDGKDHLVNAQALGSDGAGQEDTVKESQDPGGNAGRG